MERTLVGTAHDFIYASCVNVDQVVQEHKLPSLHTASFAALLRLTKALVDLQ